LGYGAIWGTVDWPQNTDLPKHHLSQRYVAASHMIGALPIGTLPDEPNFKAAIFCSLPSDGYSSWQNAGRDAWKAKTTALWPALAPFVNQITDPDQMTMAQYSLGTLKCLYNNRLVHIGDAAHCASPQLGQGANMALLDELALSRALASHPIAQALPAYARARGLHTKIYQAMSWAFTPMYQSNSKILPILRDRVLFPVSQIPPMPHILTSLVCGTMVSPMQRL
jgi:2-polyprenyl-6-methoxyphenol hydroxylase-like FAD-dependent oxidoreductase